MVLGATLLLLSIVSSGTLLEVSLLPTWLLLGHTAIPLAAEADSWTGVGKLVSRDVS